MSREERKMAHIIASIERMEQEQRRAGGDSDGQQSQQAAPAAAQQPKAPKGGRKKLKARGRKLKVAPTMDTVAVERKLTPKKRWIQLWSAQLREVERPEDDAGTDTPAEHDEADDVDPTQEQQPREQEQQQTATGAAEVEEAPKGETLVPTEQPEAPQNAPAAAAPPAAAPIADSTTTTTTTQATETGSEAPPAEDDGSSLRVKTPLHAEASHLSPPVERSNSPAPASISPSAKVKEGESPPTSNSSVATTDSASSGSTVAPAKASPTAAEDKRVLVKASSTSSLVSDSASRKRSMERDLESMTPEERRREERRRKRKSNWDVGDPRFGGSPASTEGVGIPPGGVGRFPPGRPMWRHSSSLDMKQGGHFPPRSSFNNTGGPPVTPAGRRGFYHSTSMPLDRSRSAGRPSRYNYGGGFR